MRDTPVVKYSQVLLSMSTYRVLFITECSFYIFTGKNMECVFTKVGACSKPDRPVSISTEQRIASIITASIIREDGLHAGIERNISCRS